MSASSSSVPTRSTTRGLPFDPRAARRHRQVVQQQIEASYREREELRLAEARRGREVRKGRRSNGAPFKRQGKRSHVTAIAR